MTTIAATALSGPAAVRAHLAKMRARHQCRTLLGCQDHMLRDIGASRADLEAEILNSYR